MPSTSNDLTLQSGLLSQGAFEWVRTTVGSVGVAEIGGGTTAFGVAGLVGGFLPSQRPGWLDRLGYEAHDRPKQLFVRELVKHAARGLRGRQLPAGWRAQEQPVDRRCLLPKEELLSLWMVLQPDRNAGRCGTPPGMGASILEHRK